VLHVRRATRRQILAFTKEFAVTKPENANAKMERMESYVAKDHLEMGFAIRISTR